MVCVMFVVKVTFIAINCWTGPCQKEYQLEYFPQLVAYHTSFPGIPYPESSDVQSLYMVSYYTMLASTMQS